ncbi:MAG: hypothetical protein ACKVW3_07790 [Phycisphaerales bacterium]
MKKIALGVAMVLAAGTAANAVPVLQMDINSFTAQARNGAGANVAFGGTTHTGSVAFSMAGSTMLNSIAIQSVQNGPFVNAGFSGSLFNFTGVVNLVNGAVTGGNLVVSVNSGTDNYSASISNGSGFVSTYVGGGFKIEALTFGGLFSDANFGNVNVSPWFAAQTPNGLLGSFLQFNFAPDATGKATADMDLFVDVVPLPPAAWAGLTLMGGILGFRRLRKA